MNPLETEEKNNLFPVFLKLEKLHVLIVGGGTVALEKLKAILENSPATSITIVAKNVSEEIKTIANVLSGICIIEKSFERSDLKNQNIIIVAVNDKQLGKQIRDLAHENRLLVNVADTPWLCDFYLGSVVQKGQVKIAISTNGKSPTIAKRLKEIFQKNIPNSIHDIALSMSTIRSKLQGSFKEKVEKLNSITKILAEE